MAQGDINFNVIIGQLINNPLFWIICVFVGIFFLLWKLGVFGRNKEPFKPETLEESLKSDLRPRMKIQGQKLKNEYLIQGYHSLGKIRKYSLGNVEFEARKLIEPKGPVKRGRKKKKPEVKLIKETANVIYFTVGGNTWISWVPIIGKNYEPVYYIIDREMVTREAQSKKWAIDPDVHVYPYGTVWVSSNITQHYLTELEARRSQEFEAETNINTLKRWTYYNEGLGGRIVVKERDSQLDKEKWDEWREGE